MITNGEQIRQLIENWAAAVRRKDIDQVLAHHADDLIMFDVPPPFQSIGIGAYRDTWNLFFSCAKPDVFDIDDLKIFAGEDVAFCIATMHCEDSTGGNRCVFWKSSTVPETRSIVREPINPKEAVG